MVCASEAAQTLQYDDRFTIFLWLRFKRYGRNYQFVKTNLVISYTGRHVYHPREALSIMERFASIVRFSAEGEEKLLDTPRPRSVR